jgi:hypothetical protein
MIPEEVRLRLRPWRTDDGHPDGIAEREITWRSLDFYSYVATRYCYERGIPTAFGDRSYYILDWEAIIPNADTLEAR